MIGTGMEQGSASPTLTGWLCVDSDVYLDARRPGWQAHERAGLVRYAHPPGERRGRVFVEPTATEIITALVGPSTVRLENNRPAETEALPR